MDNEQTARVAENEFHRSGWWDKLGVAITRLV